MCSMLHNLSEYSQGNNSSNSELYEVLQPGQDCNESDISSLVMARDDEGDPRDECHGETFNNSGSNSGFSEDFKDSNEALDLSTVSNRPADRHMALEALRHANAVMSQFTASAIGSVKNYEDFVSELAVVQSTFFNVHRQRLIQLQLIQHLQNQLKQAPSCDGSHEKLKYEDDDNETRSNRFRMCGYEIGHSPESSQSGATNDAQGIRDIKNASEIKIDPEGSVKSSRLKSPMTIISSSTPNSAISNGVYRPLLGDISSSLASSIITNHDPRPPPNELNCLEMLQRRTEEVLDSASQSHASHMQEEIEFSQNEAQAGGEIFKHRCKYCGKIFGSYSALQIHLRSHTGERPFHCSVCGSKFTTKGNLKVHYQRHTQIYPSILMGTLDTPMPEGPAPTGHPLVTPRSPLSQPTAFNRVLTKFRRTTIADAKPHARINQNPEDPKKVNCHEEKKTCISQDEKLLSFPITEDTSDMLSDNSERCATAQTSKRCSNVRKRSCNTAGPDDEGKTLTHEASRICKRSCVNRISDTTTQENTPGDLSITQMERMADKSWEDLIEVDKTSETSKLQQLVDNIEKTLTDPNQCIFCQKIMSCRSSLQMHIRTHTGERPFRCRICRRAFATKGNLKAHMSIHKIKPPMRSQFKCPVCHQKFSNGIILQQHIHVHAIDDGECRNGQIGENTAASVELNTRTRRHMDACTDDQSSSKSMGTSEKCDFSTASDYSEHRSESSQGDIDDIFVNENLGESPENSCSVLLSSEGRNNETLEDNVEYKQRQISSKTFEALDLSSRSVEIGSARYLANKNMDWLPVLEAPPKFLLMTAAREEVQPYCEHPKTPILPFSPFGLMGLNQNLIVCSICLKTFPNQATLEYHHYNQHTKDSSNQVCWSHNSDSQLRAGKPEGPINATNTTQNSDTFRWHERYESTESAQQDRNPADSLKEFVKPEPNTTVEQRTTSTGSHRTKYASLSPIHLQGTAFADLDHPLLKMQLMSSFPHMSNSSHLNPEGSRLPLASVEFQQALLSVGTPGNNLDTPPNNKHFCHECRRNFSSSSALQIHMRTHTGDKPFQCNVCQKAFTTKGNLKVHMGTHMWSNPTSRRGRRLSLELPMHRSTSLSQDPQFAQRHLEMFYPCLTPFFSGIPGKPSNEISSAFNNFAPLHLGSSATPKYSSSLLQLPPFLASPYQIANIAHLEFQYVKAPDSSSEEWKPVDSTGPEKLRHLTPLEIKSEDNLDACQEQLDSTAKELAM